METGALVGTAAAVLAVLALVAALLVRTGRARRARREVLAADLARSRADVEALSRRVTDLADELRETRRAAAADHEYVITSLGGEVEPTVVDALLLPDAALRRRVELGRVLEDRLMQALSHRSSWSADRMRDAAVRTVALAHGVRRALSPDILDRAAAESQVARRRSRRNRRKELRDARRLLRSVSAANAAPSADSAKAQDVA